MRSTGFLPDGLNKICPSISAWPGNNFNKAREVTDFPEPLSPTIAVSLPRFSVNEIFFTAGVRIVSCKKEMERLETVSRAPPSVPLLEGEGGPPAPEQAPEPSCPEIVEEAIHAAKS